jgi:hypothetical protein
LTVVLVLKLLLENEDKIHIAMCGDEAAARSSGKACALAEVAS